MARALKGETVSYEREVRSPDGQTVAYERDGNLYVRPAAGGPEQRLTSDGTPDWGYGLNNIANFERPDIVNTGITIVGKRVVIPEDVNVGRNVVIGPGVEPL